MNSLYFYTVLCMLALVSTSYAIDCNSFSYLRKINIATEPQLTSALANSLPGDLLVLANGTYLGNFVAENRTGTPDHSIVLCGTSGAIMTGGSVTTGSALEIHFGNYWYLAGFSITNAKKGLQFETVCNSTIDGLIVYNIGEEAIHVKVNSSYNVIKNCDITNTGKNPGRGGYGEGVYIGTAVNNGNFDFSDYNLITSNKIGPFVTAECIDIKEYTTGTIIVNNTFNGTGLSGLNSALTLVALKGNYAFVKDNYFYNSLTYGTRTSVTADAIGSWGNFNTYDSNFLDVPNCTAGIYIHNPSTTGAQNVVLCNNVVVPPTPFSNRAGCDGVPTTTAEPTTTSESATTSTAATTDASTTTSDSSTSSSTITTSSSSSTSSTSSSPATTAHPASSSTTGKPHSSASRVCSSFLALIVFAFIIF